MKIGGKEMNAFGLEGKVYRSSSSLLSITLVAYSLILWKLSVLPILISGVIGILLTFWIERTYRKRIDGIRKLRKLKTNK